MEPSQIKVGDRVLITTERGEEEREVGIHHIDASGPIDVGIQIIELAKLDPAHFDPRIAFDFPNTVNNLGRASQEFRPQILGDVESEIGHKSLCGIIPAGIARVV